MDQIDVRCINCEEIIPMEETEKHSKACTQVINFLTLFPNSSELSYLKIRLKNIQIGLERLKKNFSTSLESPSTLQILKNTCDSLSQSEEISSESLTANLLAYNTVKNIYVSNSDNKLITIYRDRIKLCIKEQIKIMNQELNSEKKISKQSTSISEMLETKEKFLNELEKEIDDQKLKMKELEQNFGRVSIISSFIDTERSFKSNHSRNSSASSLAEITFTEKSFEENEEYQKKLFYSKCLNMKLKYGSRHPAQFIQMPELFKKANDLRIPVESWDQFIEKEFKIKKLKKF